MQRQTDGSFRFSPSDLISYLEGDFAAWCDRADAEGRTISGELPAFAPDDHDDDDQELVKRKGMEHEERYVATLRARYPDFVEVPPGDEGFERTNAAMRSGVSVIYQGHLQYGAWHGYPDFLVRVDGASLLGDYHYEPWDTKLARSAKPYFLVQLSAYAEMLEALQGRLPARLCFVLGGGEELRFATKDFLHYYRQLKASFEAFQGNWDAQRMPPPGLDRSWGRWSTFAQALMAASDHLSRVANISVAQIRKLEDGGIESFTALATTGRESCSQLSGATFDILRRQARLQRAASEGAPPPWELRPAVADEPRRGFALLPPPSPEDVFFDLEGFPFAPEGLEYLWGATVRGAAGTEFHDWWAHDSLQERRAFEQFIDWAYARWRRDRSMHIYHYAAYENSAIKRLAGRYGTREFQVDEFLRNDVLVDLYTVVRQGLIVGTPSYSLKAIEHLYSAAREGDVVTAAGSVVEYQKWLDSGEPDDWGQSPILAAIRDYNRVDCESTLALRDWLLARQREAGIGYIPLAATGGAAPSGEPSSSELLVQKLAQRAEQEGDPEKARVAGLLAGLIEFHRREEKPMWWRYFTRHAMTAEELQADADCLAGLVRTDRAPRPEKKSTAVEYQFDPDQDTRLRDGAKCIVASYRDEERHKLEILTFDGERGVLELKVGQRKAIPDALHLIPDEHVSADALKEAVQRFGAAWADGQPNSPAVDDLLFRRKPRIGGHPGGELIRAGEDFTAAASNLVGRLEHTTLCIQGPPGAGKTTIAAAIITDLVRQGKRVGVAANSHKVVVNLLGAVERAIANAGVTGSLYKVGGDRDDLVAGSAIGHVAQSRDAAALLGAGGVVIGGTAWLFSRDEIVGALDYLFIDEAGQVSLANAVAMGQCASNLVLIGDQMQLGQPTQGTHPGESGMSCLDYLLQGHATIPPDLGIFLGTSYRMHPDVCRFVSESFYDGRLTSDVATANNQVVLPPGASIATGAGVLYRPVESKGCTQSSDEEAAAIEAMVGELLQGQVTIKGEDPRPVTLDDILIVAPFNMQVRLLRNRLGPAARIGSVDKFQGQEAPVVIVSMCASTLEEAPRGAEFLLSPNRLNVAVSRAQALAIVVGSPGLADARCRSVREMQLVNLWCAIVDAGGRR